MFFHLLLSYADVFAVSMTGLGRMSKLKHSIHTGNAATTWQPVRRIFTHRRDEIRTLLNEMLKKEVVEPSTSPWTSPTVLVKKKMDRRASAWISGN